MSLDLDCAASSAPAPGGDEAPPSTAPSRTPGSFRLPVTLVLAILSLEALLAGFGWQQSPGTGDTFLEFAVIPIILGSIVGLPLIILWTVFAHLSFPPNDAPRRGWAIMFAPQICGLAVLLMALVSNPPSPHTFLRKLAIDLPSDAFVIRLKAHPFVDAAHVACHVRASPESTRLIIERLRLRESDRVQFVESVVHGNLASNQPQWTQKRAYVRRDRNGTGYCMISNQQMTEFLLACDPLLFKADTEER